MQNLQNMVVKLRKSKIWYWMAFLGPFLFITSYNINHSNSLILIISFFPMIVAYALFIIEIVILNHRKQYRQMFKLIITAFGPLLLVALSIVLTG